MRDLFDELQKYKHLPFDEGFTLFMKNLTEKEREDVTESLALFVDVLKKIRL